MKKRTFLSLTLSLIMLSFAPALTYFETELAQAPSVSLPDSVDKDIALLVIPHEPHSLQRIPSCVHTKSHLQFTNTHKTDTIKITSLEAYPTNDTLQMHVSHFQQRTVIIKPLSSVLLPITFIPKIPFQTKKWKYDLLENSTKRKWLSKAAAADLAELMGSENLDFSFQNTLHHVVSKLVLRTSRGTKVVILKGSALKGNPYRLPHQITFYKDGFVSSGEFLAEQERLTYLTSNRRRSSYIYDLHIRNPSKDTPIFLNEIYTSCPDVVELSYRHDGKNRFNNCGSSYSEVLECNTPGSHELDGPPIISAGKNMTYLVTLSINSDTQNITVDENGEVMLGDLYIVSSKETFSIALRYSESNIDKENSTYYGFHLAKHDKMDKSFEEKSADPIILQKDGKGRLDCDPMNNETIAMVTVNTNLNQKPNLSPPTYGSLLSSQSNIDFGLLTTYGATREIGISITNHGNHSLRLMRKRVSLDVPASNDDDGDDDVILLSTDGQGTDHFAIKAYLDAHDKPKTVKKGEEINDIATLRLTSIFSSTQNEIFPIVCRGTVLLHFGPSDEDYNEWKKSVIDDPYGAQENIVEISFIVRIMYGSIQYNLNSVYFPTPMASSYISNESKADTNSQCAQGFHRKIHFMHDFPTSLRLTGLSIKDDNASSNRHFHKNNECEQIFEIFDFEDSKQNRKYSHLASMHKGENWGAVTLRYNYFPYSSKLVSVNKCVLVLETDLAGSLHVPLHIYSYFTKFDSDKAVVPVDCQNGDHVIRTMDLDCFHKALIMGNNVSSFETQGSIDLIQNDYIQELKSTVTKSYIKFLEATLMKKIQKQTTLRPILLSLGSLSSNSVEKYSIHLKNYNPFPIVLNTITSGIEGMEIRLAQTSVGIFDLIEHANGKIVGKEYESNKWLKQFLSRTEQSNNFFQSFKTCNDISPLEDISVGMKELFKKHARLHCYHDRKKITSEKDALKQRNFNPPSVITPETNFTSGKNHFLVIGKKAYGLTQQIKHSSKWMIPPGGLAKLDLFIQTPPLNFLSDSDFSEVFTAGVILSSSVGEIIPIFASYHVLSGAFKITEISISNITKNAKVQTSPVFRTKYDVNEISTKHINSTQQSFLIENGFSADLILKNIQSCNKWMHIELYEKNSHRSIETSKPILMHSGESILATVHSTIHCSSNNTEHANPSFFHCLLDWMDHRQALSSDKCNKTRNEVSFQMAMNSSINNSSEIEQATKAFERAVLHLNEKYMTRDKFDISSYRNLSPNVSEIFNQAFKHWKILSQLGLNVVTGTAQAQFDLMTKARDNYTATPHMITTLLENFRFSTTLELPRLFDEGDMVLGNYSNRQKNSTIDFNLVPISKYKKLYVPLINPTGHTIRARLTVCAECAGSGESNVFVQSKASLKHPWWTGGSYILSDEKGDLLVSTHNVTIRTTSGSSLSLMNPSLHSSTAFTRGCFGRRCGGTFPEINGPLDYGQKVSPIGASASMFGHLSGRTYDKNGKVERIQGKEETTPNQYPPFALSSKGIEEVAIAPFSSKLLGPIYFRPTSRNHFKASVWIENSLTGLERIQLEGHGGLEKIIFLEPNSISTNIETRFNKPTLLFKRAPNESYGSITRSVFVANLGDVSVKFNGFYLSESLVSKQERTKGQHGTMKCVRRGFQILGCLENDKDTDSESFTLNPKEAKHIIITYTSDCSFRSSYVSLVLDIAEDSIEHQESLELLLGSHLDPTDVGICTNQLNRQKWSSRNYRKEILQMSSFILPLFILACIMIDIIHTVYRRQMSAIDFRLKAIKSSNKTGFKNWIVAFRCLSRGEHDSTDLTNLGKEQTRQVLLARYRKDGLIQPQCILQTGALKREKYVLSTNSTEHSRNITAASESRTSMASKYSSRKASTTVAKTLSETIFTHAHCSKATINSNHTSIDLVVPHGLDWRNAVKRGIMQWAKSSRRLKKVNISKRETTTEQNTPPTPKDTHKMKQSNHSPVNRIQNKSFDNLSSQNNTRTHTKLTKKVSSLKRNNISTNHKSLNKMALHEKNKNVSKANSSNKRVDIERERCLGSYTTKHPNTLGNRKPDPIEKASVIPSGTAGETTFIGEDTSLASSRNAKELVSSTKRNDLSLSHESNDVEHTLAPQSKLLVLPTESPGNIAHEPTDISTSIGNDRKSSQQSSTHSPKYSPIGPRCENRVACKDHDKDSKSEEDSISISDSVSTSSALEQFEQADNQGNFELNKVSLRPPPGLPPPPGFASADKLQVHNQGNLAAHPSSSSNSSVLLAYNPLLTELLLDREDTDPTETEIMATKDDDKVLLTLGEDLDVMNFFSFLDEGVHVKGEMSNAPAEVENNSSRIYETRKNALQPNPWSETMTPRALAYGIEVEAVSSKEIDRDDNGIPLLTPSMILAQDLNNTAENETEKNDVDREDLIFNFSKLLED